MADNYQLKNCKDCAFWMDEQPVHAGADNKVICYLGECRRHAPVVAFDRYDRAKTAWPTTYEGAGCGDFLPLPKGDQT